MSAIERELKVLRGFCSSRGDEACVDEAEQELERLRAALRYEQHQAERGDAIERQELQEEREHAAMERMAKLYAEMAREFADEGKTRRWHSLMQRAEHVRGWWHAEAP